MAQEKISVAEMARRLNCSISNITYLLRQRAIAGQRTKSGWNVNRKDFEAYISDYISILEAEENIGYYKEELEASKRCLKSTIKQNRTLEWLFKEAIKQLNNIFIKTNTHRFFDIEKLFDEGLTVTINEKEAEWNISRARTIHIINRELRRLIQKLKDMPAYEKLQEENKALQVKLAVKQMTIDNLMAKLKYEESHADADIQENELLLTKIIDIEDFSIRTLNALYFSDVKTVSQLCQKTEYDLLKIRNFGGKSLNEVKYWLSKNNLQLKKGQPQEEKNKYHVNLQR